jgi:hypothetical protein
MIKLNDTELDDLHFCDEYAAYIMAAAADPSRRVICNGDSLLAAQEDGFLFEEFLQSIGYL